MMVFQNNQRTTQAAAPEMLPLEDKAQAAPPAIEDRQVPTDDGEILRRADLASKANGEKPTAAMPVFATLSDMEISESDSDVEIQGVRRLRGECTKAIPIQSASRVRPKHNEDEPTQEEAPSTSDPTTPTSASTTRSFGGTTPTTTPATL